MKLTALTLATIALTATSAMATGHGPAASNGQGDGKGRTSIAFEVSKSAREAGATARALAATLTEAIRGGQEGGFVKDEDE